METPSCSGTGRPSEQLHDNSHRALPKDEGADQHGDHSPGLRAALNSGSYGLHTDGTDETQTWEDKEGAAAADDADDLAEVGQQQGQGERYGDPQDG